MRTQGAHNARPSLEGLGVPDNGLVGATSGDRAGLLRLFPRAHRTVPTGLYMTSDSCGFRTEIRFSC